MPASTPVLKTHLSSDGISLRALPRSWQGWETGGWGLMAHHTAQPWGHGDEADAGQMAGEHEWTSGSGSPQRQEGCTTKAVGTGTEKGH